MLRRFPLLTILCAALLARAQEVEVPPLMEYAGRADVAVVARCLGPDRDFRFAVLAPLKGDAGGTQLLLKVREANIARWDAETEPVVIEPGTDYLLFLRAPRGAEKARARGESAPVFFLFDATRGAVALRGPEGAALRVAATSLGALAASPVEGREAAIRARFLALAGRLPALALAEGFELIELARVIDRFGMGTPEMTAPLLALSARPPAPLAVAVLRVLTQIAADHGLEEFDMERLLDLALRDSLAPEAALRRQAISALRALPGPRPEQRLERMGREDPDEANRLAAQAAVLDRRAGKVRFPSPPPRATGGTP